MLKNYKEFILAIAGTGLFVFLFLIFGFASDNWKNFAPDDCIAKNKCYCEHLHEGIIRQPANTLSNIPFIIVGLSVLWWIGWQRTTQREYGPSNPMASKDKPFYQIAYGIVAIFMGLGSLAYHGSITHMGGVLDRISMYMFTSFLAVYAFQRLTGLPNWLTALVYTTVNVLSFLGVMAVGIPSEVMMVIHVGLFTIFQILVNLTAFGNETWGWVSLSVGAGLFIVAFVIWLLSQTGGSLCNSATLFQGHAFWQIFSAGMVGCVYLFFRSECPKTR